MEAQLTSPAPATSNSASSAGSFSVPSAANSVASNENELFQSRWSMPLLLAYKALGGGRRRKVASFIFDLISRAEQGSYRSATLRKLLERDWGVVVGAHSYGECMKPGTLPPGVTIGRYSSIGPGVRVYNQNHPIECVSTHPYFYDSRLKLVAKNPHPRRALYIGHDVWIGTNAIITPGCGRIGDGAIIGAGAVVTKDVDDFAIVAGSPAKMIRYRFSEQVCQAIKQSRWWELPIERLAEELTSFMQPATETDVVDSLRRRLSVSSLHDAPTALEHCDLPVNAFPGMTQA